jgi:hypothetical protein
MRSRYILDDGVCNDVYRMHARYVLHGHRSNHIGRVHFAPGRNHTGAPDHAGATDYHYTEASCIRNILGPDDVLRAEWSTAHMSG